MKKHLTYNCKNVSDFMVALQKVLPNYEVFALLHGANVSDTLVANQYEFLAGIGTIAVYNDKNAVISQEMSALWEQQDFRFGYVAYDLNIHGWFENPLENTVPLPYQFFWFVPEYTVFCEKNSSIIQLIGTNPEDLLNKICEALAQSVSSNSDKRLPAVNFEPMMSKKEYLKTVQKIQKDIVEGTFYEMNFCQEFVANDASGINPFDVWEQVAIQNPVPFAAFVRVHDFYIISASPERFIKKIGNKVFSQPIKGTSKRSLDADEDEKIKHSLRHNPKELAENVMIVDLVRNDMSQCCEVGSVRVDELFGIYSFPSVHQMISTVSGNALPNVGFDMFLKNMFPMGSMTGAPKKMVVEKAAEYEKTARGVYSGCIGYISPRNDFDLNVVIRTLIVDKQHNKASYHVGGAITFDSVPELEYEECLLKAHFWRALFGKNEKV
jgi:para-aminobenzoate synthetase component 1